MHTHIGGHTILYITIDTRGPATRVTFLRYTTHRLVRPAIAHTKFDRIFSKCMSYADWIYIFQPYITYKNWQF